MQQISQSTTWSAGQTITLTDDVQVAPGVTLTIAPGAIIEGNGHALNSFGTVYAHGEIGRGILFNNVNMGLSGSSNYDGFLDLDKVQIYGGSIERAGQYNYGHFNLTNSLISNLTDYIYAWYPTGATKISGNIFVDSPGITTGTSNFNYSGTGYGTIVIDHNVFDRYSNSAVPTYNSNYAITSFAGYGTVKPSSHDNAFLDTGNSTLVLKYDSGELISHNDYFGTTDPNLISKMIYDRNDDYSIANTIDLSTVAHFVPEGLPTSAYSYLSFVLPEQIVVSGQLLGSRNVNLTGNNLNNTLIGNAGDNIIAAGGGSNLLLGNAGDDKLVFSFKLTDTSISYDAAGHTVLDGPNGVHNAFSGFERIQFTDGIVNENSGSGLVDDLFYYVSNKDVWSFGLDAETHYNQSGWHEGRNPNAEFSTIGYLAANSDVAKSGTNPLNDYATNGWKTGRDPSASFDVELYLMHNPDVKAAGIDPLTHYLQWGQAEGRQAFAAVGRASDLGTHPGFDAEYYLLSNLDVAQAALATGGDTFAFAYQHYEANGWREGRNPNAVFDTQGYLATYTDVAAANIDPLAHYHQYGFKEGRDPSAAFDTRAYEATYADVKGAGLDPMLHYLQYGALEGRSALGDGHFG